jgi:hypothetical protein
MEKKLSRAVPVDTWPHLSAVNLEYQRVSVLPAEDVTHSPPEESVVRMWVDPAQVVPALE